MKFGYRHKNVFGFPLILGKPKKRIAKKHLRKSILARVPYTQDKDIGAIVNDCTGNDNHVFGLNPAYYHRRGTKFSILADVDLITNATGASLISCCSGPEGTTHHAQKAFTYNCAETALRYIHDNRDIPSDVAGEVKRLELSVWTPRQVFDMMKDVNTKYRELLPDETCKTFDLFLGFELGNDCDRPIR